MGRNAHRFVCVGRTNELSREATCSFMTRWGTARGERTALAKAPLCKGSLPTVWGDVCEADRGDGASACRERETEGLFLSNSNLYNPSVIFLRKCHLPLHKGGYSYVRTTPTPHRVWFVAVCFTCGVCHGASRTSPPTGLIKIGYLSHAI